MPKTVLLVEDDADARAIYYRALTERGYHVVTAAHGAEGVHLTRRHRPALILMDIQMPVMDGWQATKYIRSDSTTARIPIWAISAYLSADEIRDQPVAKVVDRLIAKPVSPPQLVEEVGSFMGPPPIRPLIP